MLIDLHCHVGLSARRLVQSSTRFSFEPEGAAAEPGFDSYLSPRTLRRLPWRLMRRWLGVDTGLPAGDELDAQITEANNRHWQGAKSVDRIVLLAFDEYHDDTGKPRGRASSRRQMGSDLYASNSFVQSLCAAQPDRFLLGASLHPYRRYEDRDAPSLLEDVAAAGAVLVKWLPIHQNIRADDPRTIAFLRKARELGIAMLIHYGGEFALACQHPDQESPGSLLSVLRQLHREDAMPTVIVAHAAAASFPRQRQQGHRMLVEAMMTEFAKAPLYADISGLAALGRARMLRTLARRKPLHHKLLYASDFPIPPLLYPFVFSIGLRRIREIARIESWIERDVELKRALGFEEIVFSRAAELLRLV